MTHLSSHLYSRFQSGAAAAFCGLAISLGLGSIGLGSIGALEARAESPESAPAELTAALSQMQAAASMGDVEAVMQNYSPTFTNEDGFTYDSLQTALQTLWESYDSLTYRVELQSWEPTGSGYVAETVTYIDGLQTIDGRSSKLESVIRSQQTYEAGKIVAQQTLSERNQLTSGDMPPTVSVILPEQVSAGESYDFDAIVMEPLGNRYLLGAAVEEGATANDFFTGRPVELELLAAGGLFKVGEAPNSDDNRWVSALLVRDDGITVVTRRLRVE